MSTLARDFGAEYPGGREAYNKAHLEHWLKCYVPDEHHNLARADIERAMASDPEMVKWADWPAMRRKGCWLREAK